MVVPLIGNHEGGLQSALYDKPRPGAQRKLNGKQEAHLIALACSAPPEGHVRWTLKLLANRVVKLELADSIAPETVQQVLKKTNSSRGKRKNGGIPKVSSEFVANMEDALDLYAQPYDARRPVVCIDESPEQLIGDVQEPLPCKPGEVAKEDDKYERHGTCNVFIKIHMVDPLVRFANPCGGG